MAGERYGFQEDMGQTWLGFKPVAETLVAGFHAVLDDSRFKVLVPRLNAFPTEIRGIAYEGAQDGPHRAGRVAALEKAATSVSLPDPVPIILVWSI